VNTDTAHPFSKSFPPDWVDEEGASYLFSIPVEVFRRAVERQSLPSGVDLGGKRIWSRLSLNLALDEIERGDRKKPEALNSPASQLDPDKPFSVRTLAKRMECSEHHVRNLIAVGKIHAFDMGGKLLRISAAEVRRLEGDCAEPESAPPKGMDKKAVDQFFSDLRYRDRLARQLAGRPK